IVQEGPTLLLALDAHVTHPEPFTAHDLERYQDVSAPACQVEAIHRRKLMRTARSKKNQRSCSQPWHTGTCMLFSLLPARCFLLRATNRDAEATQLETRWPALQPPRAWLGIQTTRSTEPPGLLVEQVSAESPAAHAGIQPYDVIVRFNA